MSLRINNNIEALNAWRALNSTSNALQKSMEKLSSGLRINRAGDDAAGLAISEKLRAQIRGLNQAIRNAQDGISLIQTAEGGLSEIQNILQRMRELGVQAANGTLNNQDISAITTELNQLFNEIDRIAGATEFNTKNLLAVSTGLVVTLQVGANAGQVIAFTIDNAGTASLGLSSADLAINDNASASAFISKVDSALQKVSTYRANLGSIQNRLEHTIANLGIASENLSASESRIRDVDMAAEMMNFTKNQILQQAGVAILAQANQAPQAVLQLLR
ncbi:flagellin [Carboxydothermus hydrogenoformans]|uniref:Flagellin n=1 Tax=Carboxydothermus hydrogenoformans (strain ATCC BAA-161 / DSM 6008 / Z-2901) TaxID=246194 RepID=Q3ADF6_CARHZ|nr:flagellin [Carboxydothermus hydrogenoformans]ABB15288.1 flagellin [Carboxydothermus hydrogenoformans Z-2901]